MARSVRTDHVQNYRFRTLIMEEGSSAVGGILAATAISFLGGAFGSFSKITIPSVHAETKDFKEGTWPFTRKVISGASVDTVTMERGVTALDSSFWKWIVGAIVGDAPRQMILIELMHRTQEPALFPGPQQDRLKAATLTRTATIGGADYATVNIKPAIPVVAKRWLLHECLPIRVKPASDLDAMSADVSIAELEVHANWVEQLPQTYI